MPPVIWQSVRGQYFALTRQRKRIIMTDIQKVQSMIHGMLSGITDLESCDSKLQTIKTKYQNASPNLAGANLNADQVIDTTALITWLHTGLTTHGATIAMLKSKFIKSHRGVSLD